jgi:7-cyano-7-deazaguanine tRNA-ribosyltransferase
MHHWVKVNEDAEPFVSKGRSTFAKHVVDADEALKPQDEVVVINVLGEVLAVGRAQLSGKEMKEFSRGIAVSVRRGSAAKS